VFFRHPRLQPAGDGSESRGRQRLKLADQAPTRACPENAAFLEVSDAPGGPMEARRQQRCTPQNPAHFAAI
jgi:hypothetical protein